MSEDAVTTARAGVARIRGLIKSGEVDDPAVVALVQSLEERLNEGPIDQATVAQLERLVELSHNLLFRHD